ncbi:hypothetical protein BD289DRAFT_18758 [Coniella lustricola]|uniref:Uncharacterized protein n=1 Tax=Coniella lustricola TaxID=2025994 RepID=A0A2T3AJE0_9PEZI|nr:hypothetical protein BD289DRAFT_18758 [Coniella lustricola]
MIASILNSSFVSVPKTCWNLCQPISTTASTATIALVMMEFQSSKDFNRVLDDPPLTSKDPSSPENTLEIGQNVHPKRHGSVSGSDGGSGGGGGGVVGRLVLSFTIMALATGIFLFESLADAALAYIHGHSLAMASNLTEVAASIPDVSSFLAWVVNCSILVGLLPGLLVLFHLAALLLKQIVACCSQPSFCFLIGGVVFPWLVECMLSCTPCDYHPGCLLVRGWVACGEKQVASPNQNTPRIPLLASIVTIFIHMAHVLSQARVARDLKMWLASIRKRRPSHDNGHADAASAAPAVVDAAPVISRGREVGKGAVRLLVAAIMLRTVDAVPVTESTGNEAEKYQGESLSLWVTDIIIMTITASFAVFGVPQPVGALLEQLWAWCSAVIERRINPVGVFDEDAGDDDDQEPFEEDFGFQADVDTLAALAGDETEPSAALEQDSGMPFSAPVAPIDTPQEREFNLDRTGAWCETLPEHRLAEVDDDDLHDYALEL